MDMVFLLDTSDGAINQPANGGRPMQNFVNQMIDNLRCNSNVAVVSYGSSPNIDVPWTSYTNARNQFASTGQLVPKSSTNTDEALRTVRERLFGANDPSRQNVNLVILITEGPQATGDKLTRYQRECRALRNQGVRIIVIGESVVVPFTLSGRC